VVQLDPAAVERLDGRRVQASASTPTRLYAHLGALLARTPDVLELPAEPAPEPASDGGVPDAGETRPQLTKGPVDGTLDPPAESSSPPAALPIPLQPDVDCGADRGPCGRSHRVASEDAALLRERLKTDTALAAVDCVVDCPNGDVLASKNIVGVRAFRGWSHNIHGARGGFEVETSAVQKWQSASRASATAFNVNGGVERTVSRSNGAGIADRWPQLGDGFKDQPWWDGHMGNYGRDTWRWERRAYTDPYCQIVICAVKPTYEVEYLFETSYDGGTENTGASNRLEGYYKRPSEIRAGVWGQWARYAPGSSGRFHLERASEYARSATVSVSLTQQESANGSATFASSMSHQRLQRIINTLTVSSDEGTGWAYRYDGNHSPFQWQYWSCEWAPGWHYTTNHSGEQGNGCWRDGQ